MPGEITPVLAEHSNTRYTEEQSAAAHAIDLDLETSSWTKANSRGEYWVKITLAQVYCIDQVVWYGADGNARRTWSCTERDCHLCEGSACSHQFTATVFTEGEQSGNLPERSGCYHGDRVLIERNAGRYIRIDEVAITEKQGKETLLNWATHYCRINLLSLILNF